MDSGNNVILESNNNNSEHTLILRAFSDCVHAANLCHYETSFFQPHRNVMKTYPSIFDNEDLFKHFAERVISYTQSHLHQTRSSYARLTNGHTSDDIYKVEKELIAKKHRVSILHFLVVILRIQINGEEALYKKFSCYDIYTRILHILCNDASTLTLNLSNLLIENKISEIDNTPYLNEINALNKVLKELWPILRNLMTEHTFTSSEKTDSFCHTFKKTSFWTCYKYICLTKWQYVYIGHKLGMTSTNENIRDAHQISDLFFKTDSDKVIELCGLDKEQAAKEMSELKKEIEFLAKKGTETKSKLEETHLSVYQYYLECCEQITLLNLNMTKMRQLEHHKIIVNQDLFEKASNWLPVLISMLSQKNGLTLGNYKTTFTDFLELNHYLRPMELVELLPHMIKINEIWLRHFKTNSCNFVSTLLLKKHEELHQKFTEAFTQAEHIEQNRHKKNINQFVREFINIAKNISPEKSDSKESIELIDALLNLHQDIFDGKEAPIRIHEAFNQILTGLKAQANEASKQHMQKCQDKNDLYEINRFTIAYATQRINARCLFVSHVLKHPKFSPYQLIPELNQHNLFIETFELANLMLLLLIENKVPAEKCQGLYQKLESIHLLENKFWKKHNLHLYQKLQKYTQSNQNTKTILDTFKGELWSQQINALLYKLRYAHFKIIKQDINNTLFVSAAHEQKKLFDQKEEFIVKFCNITSKQQKEDIKYISDYFINLQPKIEKVTLFKPKVKAENSTISTQSTTIAQKSGKLPKINEQPNKPTVITNSAVQHQPLTQKTTAKHKPFKKPLHQQALASDAPSQQVVNTTAYSSISYDIYDFVELPVKLNNSNKTTITKNLKAKNSKVKKQIIASTTEQTLVKTPSPSEAFIAKYKTNVSITLCSDVKAVLNSLTQEGAIAFVRGGYIRDKLYQKPVNDADIVTNLELEKIIEKLESLGYSCKLATKVEDVVLLTCRKKEGSGLPIDISFSTLPLEQEAEKSDLTINSFMSFEDGVVIDYFGAIDDLNAPEIKMVSNDEEKFKNNPKKYLRNIRFSAEHRKNISAPTVELMHQYPDIISDLPYPVYVDHLKTLFLKGYATEVLAQLIEHNLYSIISSQVFSELFNQTPNLRIFLNWHFTQIDNAIKLDEKNKKQYKIEQILGLLLLPALITLPNLSAKKIVKVFIVQHNKELAAEDRHMLITRIEHNLLHYKELFSPSIQNNKQCRDITNNMTEQTITYQFSNLSINNKSESENAPLRTSPKKKKNV